MRADIAVAMVPTCGIFSLWHKLAPAVAVGGGTDSGRVI